MSTILVVGGAGYIGIQMSSQLVEAGYDVVIYDKNKPAYLQALPQAIFVQGDLAEKEKLQHLFSNYAFDAVMHFAASIEVGESIRNPQKYYDNNVVKTLQLLTLMREFAVNYFIFSSTAAVYGEPQYVPIDTRHRQHPINPYGRSKWMVENILGDYDSAYGLRYASLRYFNASGADPQNRFGECHDPETHLIPLVLQVANHRREHITVFGNDYDTPDGSCIRDYIHVDDLCRAHLLALKRLQQENKSLTYNLGNGNGFSILEVIDAARKITGKEIKTIMGSRRPGDPARLIADASLAVKELDWQPRYTDLETIINHAWKWEIKNYG
ncbi:MAG: UDP-glucose 4-epimerase GalE [Pseudomonadota bacterium]